MNITVYCASNPGNNENLRKAAAELGKWIGLEGHTLVYGGGDAGFMGIIAEHVRTNGGKVIGVLPGDVAFIRERPQPWCTEVITAPDMAGRKKEMLNLGDAFIALPGGIGTLDEITEAIMLNRVGVVRKPTILWNTDGYYEPLRMQLIAMEKNGFMTHEEISKAFFTDDLGDLAAFLKGAGLSQQH